MTSKAHMDLSPEQVKAGRALLAWSQQELAGKARVGVSTVADFERGSRTPVANNAQAIREALESQGLKFMAGGVVEQAMLPPVPPAPKAGTLMRWVTSTHLAEWAARRTAQSTLPELISRLIYATVGPAASLVFPSDESVQHAGWDGVCTVGDNPANPIPGGVSGWELGAQRSGIKGKADDDYEHRTANPLGLDQKLTTFVFVTPNRFANKAAWENEKRARCVWRDVRVIDADILVHWLEMCPAVAQWLAEKMNRRPKGLRSLHEIWEEWSLATQPPLTAEVVLTDRDEESTAILKWLREPASTFALRAEAPEEAIAFLHASIARLPPNYRLYHESRCVVVADENVARDLVGLGTPLIIVMPGANAGLHQRLVDDGHYVFAVVSDDERELGARKLRRPWRFNLRMALTAAGVGEEEAYRLSNASGRSLAVLRRLMPPELSKIPAWATSSVELNAAMLAGGWNERSAVDRKIVSFLADKPYEEVETALAPLAATEGGPLRRIGPIWKLTSLHDAWPMLAPTVSKSQFERLEKAFQQVLETPNPRFGIAHEDHIIEREGQFGEEASHVLRQGLSEAIIALSIYPDSAKALPDAAVRADAAVRKLLRHADDKLWWSLRDVFRELAEASPKEFLAAVEVGLEGAAPIMALFGSEEGVFHPREYLSDLLWALEVLARSPDYLPHAGLLLARLNEVDPGGKMGNRPSRSLRQIFLPWTPQTYATPEQRMKVIDQIAKRYPKTGWNLLLAIAPRNHDTSQPSPHPNWRDFTPDVREHITWATLRASAQLVGTRLLKQADHDVRRWDALIDRWSDFDQAWRHQAVDQLGAFVKTLSDPADVELLRDSLRDVVQKHRNFSDADWAMPETDLTGLDSVLAMLEPSGPQEKHRWLFKQNSNFLRPNVPWQELQREQEDLQIAAASDLLETLTPGQFLDFAATVTLNHALGIAVAKTELPAALKTEVLEAALKDGRDTAGEVAAGIMLMIPSAEAEVRLHELWQKAQDKNWGQMVELRIVRMLPLVPATWAKVAARSPAFEEAYWQSISPPFQPDQNVDIDWVASKLIDADRSRDAMAWLGQNLNREPRAETLMRVLHAAASTEGKGGNDTTMFSYYLGLILDYLEKDDTVPEKDLVQLEWIYFQALRYSQRPPRTLNKALAQNPEFFAQLICYVYLPDPSSDVKEAAPADFEKAKNIATQAWNVLHDWSRVPGADDAGRIDGSALEAWVKTARKLLSDAGRGEIGDQKIGDILAASAREGDQPWPPEAVREIIETIRSRHLEEGIVLGVINRRGVTVRSPLDGGEQERDLAGNYRHDANELRFDWNRTAAVLDRIAEHYERDASREDISAELRDLE